MSFIEDILDVMAKKELKDALSDASMALKVAENLVDSEEKRALIRLYRGKINEVSHMLSKFNTTIKNYHIAKKIVSAVSDLQGNIRDNPQKSAKAFGKLFSGIGQLSHYLPFPINSYFAIFADAENFFENLRIQMQPEIHFKEPGLREVIENL
jgi:hypothetical protein